MCACVCVYFDKLMAEYILQPTATHCNSLQFTATHYNAHDLLTGVAQCSLWFGSVSVRPTHSRKQISTHCNSLQLTATHCNSLQLTATHCNTHYTIYVQVWRGVPCGWGRYSDSERLLQLTATHCNSLQLTAFHYYAHYLRTDVAQCFLWLGAV